MIDPILLTFFKCRTRYHYSILLSLFKYCHWKSKFNYKMPKPGYYAVRNGKVPGIYRTWAECEAQVKGYQKAMYKKFLTLSEAESYIMCDSFSQSKIKNMQKPSNHTAEQNIQSYCRPPTSIILSESDLIDSAKLIELLCPDMSKPKGSFYAVHRGANPGIYMTWTECEAQIKNMKNASFRKFNSEEEALEYVRTGGIVKATKREVREIEYKNDVMKRQKISHDAEDRYILANPNKPVVIFTDGASSQNGKMKARAGIGVYWGPNHPLNTSKRIPGRQTNNRAEIHAAVHALSQAKEIGASKVRLYTDSQFLIHSITDWIKKWKTNGWKLANGDNVVNKDDFLELEAAGKGLDVEWVYIKAHAKNHGNEEADRLAVAGSRLLLEPANISKYSNSNKKDILNTSDIEPFLLASSNNEDDILPLIIPEERIEKKTYYAVYRGKMPGVYTSWVECEAQIKDELKPVFRKFNTRLEALEFSRTGKMPQKVLKIPEQGPDYFISVFTDSFCLSCGKSGVIVGIGVYWGPGNELNTSMRLPGLQTNNRAEIHAAIYALKQARHVGITSLRLYTNSQYVINGINTWINNWKVNNWLSASGKPVSNKEDFMALDRAQEKLNVDWHYVKSHDNNPGYVEANKLATAGCNKSLSEALIFA